MRAQLPFHINSFEALLCNQAAVPQARLEKLSGHQVPYPCGKGFWRGCRRLQLGVPGPWVHSWGITVLFLYFCMLFFFFFSSSPLTATRNCYGQRSACPLGQWEAFCPGHLGGSAAPLFVRGDALGLHVISSGYQGTKCPEFI